MWSASQEKSKSTQQVCRFLTFKQFERGAIKIFGRIPINQCFKSSIAVSINDQRNDFSEKCKQNVDKVQAFWSNIEFCWNNLSNRRTEQVRNFGQTLKFPVESQMLHSQMVWHRFRQRHSCRNWLISNFWSYSYCLLWLSILSRLHTAMCLSSYSGD